jgi:hypothetical protein
LFVRNCCRHTRSRRPWTFCGRLKVWTILTYATN